MFSSRMEEENVGKYSDCCLENEGTSQKREFRTLSVSYLNQCKLPSGFRGRFSIEKTDFEHIF